jgi:hypothetical protein
VAELLRQAFAIRGRTARERDHPRPHGSGARRR